MNGKMELNNRADGGPNLHVVELASQPVQPRLVGALFPLQLAHKRVHVDAAAAWRYCCSAGRGRLRQLRLDHRPLADEGLTRPPQLRKPLAVLQGQGFFLQGEMLAHLIRV